MHESFRQAINPKPLHACLRIPLKPLTLGHKLFLYELESPVVVGGSCGFGDILLAVLVCAQPHDKARKMVLKSWWLKIFAWYWGFRCAGLDLREEVDKFKAYLRFEQSAPPTAAPPKEQSRSIGSPWEWVLFEMLRSTYRLSESEAMHTPFRTANALWVVRGDQDGRITLATASDSVSSVIKSLWRRQRELTQQSANN